MSGIQMIMAGTTGGASYYYAQQPIDQFAPAPILLVDNTGSYYTVKGAGNSYRTVIVNKYTAAGAAVWGKQYGHNGSYTVSLTPTNGCFDNPDSPTAIYIVSALSNTTTSVVKLSTSTGALLWGSEITGLSSWEPGYIAVSSGNVYVAGAGSSVTWVTTLNNSTGAAITKQTYAWNNRNNSMSALGVAPAPNGDVYLACVTTNSNNSLVWMRLTSALTTPTWRFWTSNSIAIQAGVESDASGNLYIHYQYNTSPNGWKYSRAHKIDTSGAITWTRDISPAYSGSAQLSCQTYKPGVNRSTGDVYFTGYSNFGSNFDSGYLVGSSSTGTSFLNRTFSIQNPGSYWINDTHVATQGTQFLVSTAGRIGQYSYGNIIWSIPNTGNTLGDYLLDSGYYETYGSGRMGFSTTSYSGSSTTFPATYSTSFTVNTQTPPIQDYAVSLTIQPFPA